MITKYNIGDRLITQDYYTNTLKKFTVKYIKIKKVEYLGKKMITPYYSDEEYSWGFSERKVARNKKGLLALLDSSFEELVSLLSVLICPGNVPYGAAFDFLPNPVSPDFM